MMPYPFSRGVFIYAEPIYVAKDAGDREMEEARERLEGTLKEITARADGFFSLPPGEPGNTP